MLGVIHQQWPDLKHKHSLVVKHKDDPVEVVDDESFNKLFSKLGSTNVELSVDTKCLGFSDYASNRNLVEELLDCKIRDNVEFPSDETIPMEKYQEEVHVVCAELLRRLKFLDLHQASENTMRELISPVLIGALSLVESQNTDSSGMVKLICEKQISGSSGNGPVDYVLSYKSVYIVIGEAKKGDLDAGFYQNLMQQWSALESLADKTLPFKLSGNKRKLLFGEKFNTLKAKLGTFGITSTGSHWIFSRVENAPEGSAHSTIVRQSRLYSLHDDIGAESRSFGQRVETLLRIIVQMIHTQKETISSRCPDLISEDTQSHLKLANEEEIARKHSDENKDDVDDEEDDKSA